uniref:Uncharacterized protein n=1 Tax=Nippostrongylus brasiliensis TaxID=27835 RepID=A0A0N4Y1F8_NIPBR
MPEFIPRYCNVRYVQWIRRMTTILLSIYLVDIACERNPSLAFCKSKEVRRKEPDPPDDPFKEKFEPPATSKDQISPESSNMLNRISRLSVTRLFPDRDHTEEDDISLELEEETTTYRSVVVLWLRPEGSYRLGVQRPRRSTTPVPLPRQNLLYTIFPTLQKEKDWRKSCPVNQYTFQTTCLPGKKLRYDLQASISSNYYVSLVGNNIVDTAESDRCEIRRFVIFCQEFSEKCGVPNINLYPSRRTNPADEGRPKGYGQKQKNGNLGLGRSFGFGLGAIPGFEVVSSQGTDIGHENLPFLNQIGGIMLNQGTELGALGQRIGKGPARSLNALTHGYPSFGLGSEPNNGDKKLSQEVLRSLGVPNLPVFGKLGGNRPKKRGPGYEPGYGAVNPNAPLAIGKVDRDAINLPGGFGDVEMEKGGGFGFGK